MIRNPTNRDEYLAMIKERESSVKKTGVSNCIGTAEYLVGEQREDDPMSVKNNHIRGFNGQVGMRTSEKPEIGYIVAWNQNGVNYHAGVVKSVSPIEISHRDDSRGEFHRNQPIEEIKYERIGLPKLFYIPTKLEKIVGE